MERPENRKGAIQWISVFSVVVVSILLYAWWDNWWISWDGGFYLYLARSIREGHGLVFPDGSPATFRGPGYPGLFAAAWMFLDISAKTAIWASRAVLIVGGAAVAVWLARTSAGALAALAAGLIAVVPALVFEAGAWYFVPDGVAAVLTVVSLLSLLAARRPSSIWAGVIAGLLMGLAFLVKEISLVYAPIGIAVVWARAGRGWKRPAGGYLVGLSSVVFSWVLWTLGTSSEQTFTSLPPVLLVGTIVLVIAAGLALVLLKRSSAAPATRVVWGAGLLGLIAMFALTFSVLFVFGEPTTTGLAQGTVRAADELVFLLGWSWIPALILLVAALVAGRWVRPELAPTWLAGALLVGASLGQAWYSGAAALSMRNAVAGVLGLALLVGVVMGGIRAPSWDRTARSLAYAGALVFLALAGMATARIDALDRGRNASWDNPAVNELNNWLVESELTDVIVTPFYATSTWFLGGDLPRPALLEMHFAPSGRDRYRPEAFCRLVWWGGAIDRCPPDAPIAVADVDVRTVVAVYPASLDGEILVVTGNKASGSPFGGAGLLYLIETQDLGRRVFATSEDNLPHWAVVYEMDHEAVSEWAGPSVIQRGVVGIDSMLGETILLDNAAYSALLTEVLP